MNRKFNIPWKIDDATDLPLAIIEDTDEGMEIVQIGNPASRKADATETEMAIAEYIVTLHNDSLVPKNNPTATFALFEGVHPQNLGQRFFSTNRPDRDQTRLANGTVAYKIIGYADTVEEAQMKLYGQTFPT